MKRKKKRGRPGESCAQVRGTGEAVGTRELAVGGRRTSELRGQAFRAEEEREPYRCRARSSATTRYVAKSISEEFLYAVDPRRGVR